MKTLPIDYGFKKVEDPAAMGGVYYIKNGLKWIFDIKALKRKLRLCDDSDLTERGYDVDMYYRAYRLTPNKGKKRPVSDIYQDVLGDGSDMYLCDGMWITSTGGIYED